MILDPPGFKEELLTLLRSTLDGIPVIDPHAVVVEAGAGRGTVTDTLTRLARHVTAVEPLADSFEALHERTAYTQNLTLLNVAVGPPGQRGKTFLYPADNPHRTSTHHTAAGWQDPEVVDEVPLDDLIAAHRADTVVLDIEGAEGVVLAGAALRGIHTLILEWHPDLVGEAEWDAAEKTLNERGLIERLTTPSWHCNGYHMAVYQTLERVK